MNFINFYFFISDPRKHPPIPGKFKHEKSQISKKMWVEKTYLDNIDKFSACARALDMELVRSTRS